MYQAGVVTEERLIPKIAFGLTPVSGMRYVGLKHPTTNRGFMKGISFANAVLLLVFIAATPIALANSFDCASNHCGLPTRGNNSHLIVGTIESVATRVQTKEVFQWARHHGYWSNLPDNADGFTKFVQLVSLAVKSSTGSHSVTVLMTRKEFDASPLQKGALVRYSPHDAAHPRRTVPDFVSV